MRSVHFLAILILCLAGNSAYGQVISVRSGGVSGPLPVEVASGAKSFAPLDIEISPDGVWVAYTLGDPRRRKIQSRRSDQWSIFNCSGVPYVFSDSDVLITNTQTGETKNISAGRGANWGPSWSPDGEFLAFYSDRSGKAHIWLWQKSTGRLRALTTAVVHVRMRYEKIVWTPDGRQVITKILGDRQALENCFDAEANRPLPDPSAKIIYESQDPRTHLSETTVSFLADLVLLDVASGRWKTIVRQQKIIGYSLSPYGDKIAFAIPKGRKPNDQYLMFYDLNIVSLRDHSIKTVPDFSPGVPSLPLSWSSDGSALAYLSDRQCFIWELREGKPQKVIASNSFSQTPLWDQEGRSVFVIGDNRVWRISRTELKAVSITEKTDRQMRTIVVRQGGNEFWSPDPGQSLYVSTNDAHSKREGFYKVDLQSGKFIRILEGDNSYHSSLTVASPKKDAVVFASQSATRPQNLWIAGTDFADARQLTRINPDLERHRAGTARLIDYADADGRKLQATLLLPPNYHENLRYPLVVWVYGGSMLSTNVNRYGAASSEQQNMQLLSSRGYAVLLPDTPLRVGTPMQDLAKTVMPAVDKTIEMGIADGDRLGIMGQSYGGYSTLALIVQTSRFKAAVMDVGLGNLISKYGELLKSGSPLGIPWAEGGQGRMGGPPWEFRDRYVENSPVFYLDKIQTPLLINQGGMDISPYQSDEIFVGLRRLGKKVVYVRYENEGHSIEHYPNRVDYWNRLISWFDSHLGTVMDSSKPQTSGKVEF